MRKPVKKPVKMVPVAKPVAVVKKNATEEELMAVLHKLLTMLEEVPGAVMKVEQIVVQWVKDHA